MKFWTANVSVLALLATSIAGHARQVDAPTMATPVKHKVKADNELDNAPEKARARRNPLEGDLEAPIVGRKLFEQHCVECHGNAAEGGRHGPSLRHDEVQNASPGAIFWILTNGIVWHGMPVWSKLPEPQRWQLVSYIKSLGVKSRSSASPALPSPLQTKSATASASSLR